MVDVVDGDAFDLGAHQLGADIEAGHDVESVLPQTGVTHEGGPQLTDAEE